MDVFHQHHHSPKSVSHFDYKQIKHTKQEQTNISYILPKFSFWLNRREQSLIMTFKRTLTKHNPAIGFDLVLLLFGDISVN